MHLYITTRGIKRHVDKLISDLGAQYLPLKMPDGKAVKDARGMDAYVELAVRPVQLWELVFPESALGLVMKTVKPNYGLDKDTLGGLKKSVLRKALGAEPIPKDLDMSTTMIVNKDNVHIEPIGIRKDTWNKDGLELL